MTLKGPVTRLGRLYHVAMLDHAALGQLGRNRMGNTPSGGTWIPVRQIT
jgi:hypothetical protein